MGCPPGPPLNAALKYFPRSMAAGVFRVARTSVNLREMQMKEAAEFVKRFGQMMDQPAAIPMAWSFPKKIFGRQLPIGEGRIARCPEEYECVRLWNVHGVTNN